MVKVQKGGTCVTTECDESTSLLPSLFDALLELEIDRHLALDVDEILHREDLQIVWLIWAQCRGMSYVFKQISVKTASVFKPLTMPLRHSDLV